jgi:predicted ATP-binding protein involved in virulence
MIHEKYRKNGKSFRPEAKDLYAEIARSYQTVFPGREIELHLHPPMQQALLRTLPKLGKNNQFIITTHSDYVAQLVPESSIRIIEE